MEVICVKKYLKEAIGVCEKITGKNLSLPILNNILICAEGKSLKLTATNLEIGAEIIVPAKIIKSGSVAVPSGVINGFLSSFSGDENITLENQNSNLLISTESSSTIVKGQLTDDFPSLPKNNNTDFVSISANNFVSGLKSVWYACSLSNIKPEISSVYIYTEGQNLVFAATDSFRLAEKKTNLTIDTKISLLVPFKTITEIIRIFDGREGDLKLFFDKNQLFLECDNIKFISRLVDGVFPDYQQIIPKSFTTDAVVDKNAFINTLKTASIFSSKLNELNISVDPKSKFLVVKTVNADAGEHTAKVPANVTGEELKASFNHKYVFDCLAHIPSSEIILRFSGKDKPLLVTGVGDLSFQYLIMPMSGV